MPDFVLDAKLSKDAYASRPSVIDGWRPVQLDLESVNSEEIGIVEHGISVLNKGPTPISGVLVDYGELKRTFCVPHCLPRQGGGGWNAPMPIQKEIQFSWRTQDGQQHEAKVPVRDKLKDAKRLRTIYLHFYGASLIVIQGLEYSNPTIVGREVFPLHP